MKKLFFLFLALTVGISVFPTAPAMATHTTGFNMNFIVADDLFVDYASMSVNGIQEFLNNQPGILKNYSSNGRSAAQIIFEAAQAYRINPKVILANIQKESSMITRTSFNTSGYSGSQQYYLDWVMFYGWCDSCTSGTNQGFANQIDAATKAFRRYLDSITANGYTISYWGPGIDKNIQCIKSDYDSDRLLCTPGTTIVITPANAATAALYTYTPHPGGNFAFWYIWNTTFGFNKRRLYPDGSLLRAKGLPDVWLIQDGQKRRFTNSNAFLSRYNFSWVITVAADDLLPYETGREISYANHSLLSSPEGGVYLIVNDLKRPIKSRAAFNQAGYRMADVIKVSWEVLDKFTDGQPITTENIFPSGRLLQDKNTGGVFYVKDGIRHAIVSRAIFRSQFGTQKPYPAETEELEKFSLGLPVGFKDGELLTSTSGGTAYFISNGYKLPIASWQAALAYKFYPYLWANLRKVDDKSLAVHPTGPILDVDTTQTSSIGQP